MMSIEHEAPGGCRLEGSGVCDRRVATKTCIQSTFILRALPAEKRALPLYRYRPHAHTHHHTSHAASIARRRARRRRRRRRQRSARRPCACRQVVRRPCRAGSRAGGTCGGGAGRARDDPRPLPGGSSNRGCRQAEVTRGGAVGSASRRSITHCEEPAGLTGGEHVRREQGGGVRGCRAQGVCGSDADQQPAPLPSRYGALRPARRGGKLDPHVSLVTLIVSPLTSHRTSIRSPPPRRRSRRQRKKVRACGTARTARGACGSTARGARDTPRFGVRAMRAPSVTSGTESSLVATPMKPRRKEGGTRWLMASRSDDSDQREKRSAPPRCGRTSTKSWVYGPARSMRAQSASLSGTAARGTGKCCPLM